MNQAIRVIFSIAAMTLTGCICGFFIVLNYIKTEIESEERKGNDKTKRQNI